MGLSVKGGTFNSPTSTGNQSYTGIGFQPKFILLMTSLVTADAGYDHVTWGVATSSSARWAVCGSTVWNVVSFASRVFDSSKVLRLITDNGVTISTFFAADFVSFDADGFTLNWTTANASAYPVNYFVIGGTDFSAKVGTVDLNTSTGNQAVTGVGFQPKAVLTNVMTLASEDPAGSIGGSNISLGAGLSSANRQAMNHWSSNTGGATTIAKGVLYESKFWTIDNTANVAQADFVSNDNDGFTFNITTAFGTALRLGYIALGGTAQYALGTFAQPGSTGNQAVTGVGFLPSAELLWSAGRVSSASISAHARFMLGAMVSSADRGVTWNAMKDAVNSGTPQTRAMNRSKAISIYSDSAATVLADADCVSQDNSGFTVNWTTADATARVIGYLAIGAAALAAKSLAVNQAVNRASTY